MAVVIQDLNQPNYSYLGQDIAILPDLNEDESLAVDADCLIQDIIDGWTQPTGIADGTTEGAEWGIDLRRALNRGFDKAGLLALKVSMEVQAERDDRVDTCTVALTANGDTGALTIEAMVFVGAAPYPFSFQCTLDTVGNLYVTRLGVA
jgi:hypothetical protein